MEAVAQVQYKVMYYKMLKAYRDFSITQTIEFFKEFRKDRLTTGAVTQSSTVLAKHITAMANLKEKNTVVELGSGTGVFTKDIVKRLSNDATFFAIELNEFFVEQTKLNCPEAQVYHSDAKEIQKYLHSNNKQLCDCIISGLPWSCFDEKLQIELIDNIYDSLEKGGEFLTFSYVQSPFLPKGRKFKKLLEDKFKVTIKTKTVWLNLPPAFVYICRK